jgi:phage terminase small subunit
MQEARAILKKEGLTVEDEKTKAIKAHPCVAIERDAKSLMLRTLKELGLNTEAPGKAGRPSPLTRR